MNKHRSKRQSKPTSLSVRKIQTKPSTIRKQKHNPRRKSTANRHVAHTSPTLTQVITPRRFFTTTNVPPTAGPFGPILDIPDDFLDFLDEESVLTYSPQTISTAPPKHTLTLITKSCCSLCVLPHHTILAAVKKYPDKFNYMEVDIEAKENIEDWRGKYKYHIPVVQINGQTFSTGSFADLLDKFNREIECLKDVPFDGSSPLPNDSNNGIPTVINVDV